ncbi:hypothetical protein P59_252 [Bacillus phage P59]|nr:hypothetical protein P59_023 [Bacillus phage P59]QIW88849.1 hypothetical protein P59_252 [Bacillus phage P59]
MIKAWMFDYEGDMITNYFNSEEELENFAAAHGLEVFKTEPITPEAAYKETVK